MIRLDTPLGTTQMVVGVGVVRDVVPRARELGPRARRVGYVVDEHVDALWPAPTWPEDLEPVVVKLPAGEAAKQRDVLATVQDALLELRRDEPVIVRGGGAALDVGGFAAATVRRGLAWIAVPTTVVAMADAALGGKTAVNHPRGKNMIGAFHQPRLVIADTDTLSTLPDRELKAGVAEVIKYGLIRDPEFFDWLEANIEAVLRRDPDVLAETIERSCANKARIVAEDETERGVRALLNLGHTFGHAIEAGMGYGVWLHGEAVAAGMAMAATLSMRLGWMPEDQCRRGIALIARAGLPVCGPALGASRYLALMAHDKKVEAGRLRLVLLRAIGDAEIFSDVPVDDIAAAIDACCPA